MACIRVVLALSLTRINALSTTAAPTKTLFLAKPTVNAEALLQHFAAHGCGVTDVDAHTRFAFVQFESDADANRALALENGPYREAKRAHASINDRNATAAAAWDALCAKLRDVTAGAVVPRSHADRVAARLAARGHETLAVEQVGVERLLLLRTNDPAAFAAETSADAVLAGVCVPLALDGHKRRVRRGSPPRPPLPRRSTSCSATPPRAPVRGSASGRLLRRWRRRSRGASRARRRTLSLLAKQTSRLTSRSSTGRTSAASSLRRTGSRRGGSRSLLGLTSNSRKHSTSPG